jgi:hypothetical protein
MKLFLVLAFLFISSVQANEYLETPSFQAVAAKVQDLRLKYSAKDVLIVLDIDNTLLRAKQSLGSDQWFEWQSQAITNRTSEASYSSIEELLNAQASMYQMSSMALTEPTLPETISSFQSAGHKLFLLTSRSPILRNVTERELKKNKLWFGQSSIMKGIPEEIQEVPFKNPVSFMNGIFMTAGHHKGEALDYLVKKAGRRYKAIVFVDDLERHTKRVYEVFNTKPETEIVTFRYSMEDFRVENFKQGSKTEVLGQANDLTQLTRKVFKN